MRAPRRTRHRSGRDSSACVPPPGIIVDFSFTGTTGSLGTNPRLSIELFVALDVIDAWTAIDALIAAAEARAATLACTAVQIRIERGSELVSRIWQAGYRPIGELMTKEISATSTIN